MAEAAAQAALLRLLTWLSPAFPVGAFSYSHGLERAIHDGVLVDRDSLVGWLTELVERGSGWNDAVLVTAAWRQVIDGGDCADVAELAEAMAGSRERHMETTLQGEAFLAAIESWERRPGEGAPMMSPYPIAVAMTAASHGIDLQATLGAYLHAFTSNLIQAAARLVPLGQRDGVAAMAAMEPAILATAERAARSSLDDLGSATVMSEIMAMKHEIQYSRVFRS